MAQRLRLQHYSYRFAEQVLNSRLDIKNEALAILTDPSIDLASLSRPNFNALLRERFIDHGWEDQPPVFDQADEAAARLDFLKDRVGVEVAFGHASFLGMDLLKFQVASYSALNKIDLGLYVVTTRAFQRTMKKHYQQNWVGSLTFEKVATYLPHFKSAIQVPIFVCGIDA
ncbi:MAG: restriction endonuclease [Candidatus Eisenbacteria bacterium]|nr:restriction endonuclease [Candidatus Eisenbacteria bacterium]